MLYIYIYIYNICIFFSVKKVDHGNMVRSSGGNVKQLAQYFTNSLYDAVKTPHLQYELLNSIINSLHIAI